MQPLGIKHEHIRRRRLQQGQVILITVLLIATVIGISLFTLVRPRDPVLDDNVQTELALRQAKEALIAYASGRPNGAGAVPRPGDLPCPDTDNNGQVNTPCNTPATQIGRLPWATLGIPDLRDGSGERLWYAVSNNFKDNPPVATPPPLNSNTLGQLTVTGIAPASNVIAIVFAPGAVVSGQSRTAANVNNRTHYLEGENANGDTIFTTAATSGTFNDRLLAITPAMFFPPVEMRVAREMRSFLNAYFNDPTRRYFPSAHAYGATEPPCVPATQGRVPELPSACGAVPIGAVLPGWYLPNQWKNVMFYAVAPACSNPAPNCTGAGGFLTVNGVGGIRALLITPGTPYTGQTRPCATIADCLEPPNTTSFPAFTHGPASTTFNDRVVIIAP
jgi:hypothetical protein